MAKRYNEKYTGVEIGTDTIKVVIGEIDSEEIISVLGIGEQPSKKIIKGEPTDLSVVYEQLKNALVDAEKHARAPLQNVYLAATGGHVKHVNSLGSTLIHTPTSQISAEDVVESVRNARNYHLPPEKIPLNYCDRRFVVDDTRELDDPLGVVASKLEADTHLIYGGRNNIETSCQMLAEALGEPISDIHFSPIAAGFSTLDADEREKGILLIDFGAGVTEYTVFHSPGVYHSGQVTVGCDHILNDLKIGLGLPEGKCRKILHELPRFGSAITTPDGRDRITKVTTLGDTVRNIPVSSIEQVIEYRLKELLHAIKTDLRQQNALRRISSGVALCGGGSNIAGFTQLCENVFEMPVKVVTPKLVSGNEDVLKSPRYAIPFGLLRLGRLSRNIAEENETGIWRQFKQDLYKTWDVFTRAFRW